MAHEAAAGMTIRTDKNSKHACRTQVRRLYVETSLTMVLQGLKTMLRVHEDELTDAIMADLKRPSFESRAEIGFARADIELAFRCKQWMRPQRQ
eukprot:1774940-Rhodomonas_salina.1